MSTEQHSPTPWRTMPSDVMPDEYIINRNDIMIASVINREATFGEDSPRAKKERTLARANAEFILKAVNNHDALVEALKGSICYISTAFFAAESHSQGGSAARSAEIHRKRVKQLLESLK